MPSCRPSLVMRDNLRLELPDNEALALEAPEQRIHGTARQAGDFHDIEAIGVAGSERSECEREGVGDVHRRGVEPGFMYNST